MTLTVVAFNELECSQCQKRESLPREAPTPAEFQRQLFLIHQRHQDCKAKEMP